MTQWITPKTGNCWYRLCAYFLAIARSRRFTIYRSSFFFFSFSFSFYCFLFDFALLLYLALPGPALFFSALLCSDPFYVGSDRPSGAPHSDQTVTGRQVSGPRPHRKDRSLHLKDNNHLKIRLAKSNQRFSSQSLAQSSRRRS